MKKIAIILIFTSLFLILGCKKDKIRFVQNIVIDDSLTADGYMKNGLRTGYWKYFDLKKNLVAISEFKIINNRMYLNQEIVFDKKGDTLFDKSSFFTCKAKAINKDSLLLEIEYDGLFEEESYGLFVHNRNINEDFSNVDELKLDTIFFNYNKLEIKLPKDEEIRGIIQEIRFLSDSYDTRNVYFYYNKGYQDISEIR